MKTLAELQGEFLAAVWRGDTRLEAALTRSPTQTAAQRLAVYRSSVLGSMIGAMADAYPVIQALTGETFFAATVGRYMAGHPSTSPDLHVYGAGFAQFLSRFEPARDLPYLPDIARLEWAWHRAFHAADQSPQDLSQLAALSPAQQASLRLRLAPGLVVIRSVYPILEIWQANRSEPGRAAAISLDQGGVQLIVSRPGTAPEVHAVDAQTAQFLDRAAAGATLGELAATCPEATAGLAGLVQRAWIIGFKANESKPTSGRA